MTIAKAMTIAKGKAQRQNLVIASLLVSPASRRFPADGSGDGAPPSTGSAAQGGLSAALGSRGG
jgi:hypothetical protein